MICSTRLILRASHAFHRLVRVARHGFAQLLSRVRRRWPSCGASGGTGRCLPGGEMATQSDKAVVACAAIEFSDIARPILALEQPWPSPANQF